MKEELSQLLKDPEVAQALRDITRPAIKDHVNRSVAGLVKRVDEMSPTPDDDREAA